MTAPNNKDDDVMTVPEGARLLRVNPKSLYAAIGRGEVPHQRVGRKIRISRSALVAWLAQGLGRVSRSKEKSQ